MIEILFRWVRLACYFVSLNLCINASPWSAALAQSPQSDSSAPVQEQLILIVGAPGTEEYRKQFLLDAQPWKELAKARSMKLVLIVDEQDGSVTSTDLNHHDQLRAAIDAASISSPSPLWIVFIGHGTSVKKNHNFNLVGPDVSSQEVALWIGKMDRPVVFINCSSASAPFLPEISGARRIVVTATKSGSEINYSRFGTQLANAILDAGTDIDHDEEVSLLEAFLAASVKTEKFYKEQNRIATEHALIDDNGDKLGTGAEFFSGTRAVKSAPPGKQLDGDIARRVMLYSAPGLTKLTPEAEAKRLEIELQIRDLRNRKQAMPMDEYWNQLESLLLELARLHPS